MTPKRFCFLLTFLTLICAKAQTIERYGVAPDGSILQWSLYQPSGQGPWPGVILVHGGGFRSGEPETSEWNICKKAALDLVNKGYLCVEITYRLAPNGLILNQPRTFNGRTTGIAAGPNADQTIHDQMDDVRTAIHVLRNLPECDGRVFGIGGSAGGTHAIFAALTGTAGDDKLDAAVGLSGAYQFDDFLAGYNTFQSDVTNYCGVSISYPNIASLRMASPAWQDLSQSNPVLLIASEFDPMPPNQLPDMQNALTAAGRPVKSLIISGNLHSFNYWPQVRDNILDFLSQF